jgi:hypothetical protein
MAGHLNRGPFICACKNGTCGVSTGVVKHTLKNSDGRGEVVDTPGSADSGGDDRGRGDEIVGEAVVQVSL